MECGKSFAVRHYLVTHVKRVHLKVKPFECDQCEGKKFFKKGLLKSHIKAVHKKERNYRCTKCSLCTSTTEALTKHVKRVHEKIRPFSCMECGDKSFPTKCELEIHIKTAHKGEREHICNICNKTYGFKSSLSRHIEDVHQQSHSLHV